MFCTSCGREMAEGDKFCPACGMTTKPGGTQAPPPSGPPKRLSRPMNEKKIAGVCAGFARYLGIDVTLVRIVWLLVVLVGGTGIIAYLVAWIAMPKDYGPTSPTAATQAASRT